MMLPIKKVTELSLHENIRENSLKLYNDKNWLTEQKISIHHSWIKYKYMLVWIQFHSNIFSLLYSSIMVVQDGKINFHLKVVHHQHHVLKCNWFLLQR